MQWSSARPGRRSGGVTPTLLLQPPQSSHLYGTFESSIHLFLVKANVWLGLALVPVPTLDDLKPSPCYPWTELLLKGFGKLCLHSTPAFCLGGMSVSLWFSQLDLEHLSWGPSDSEVNEVLMLCHASILRRSPA